MAPRKPLLYDTTVDSSIFGGAEREQTIRMDGWNAVDTSTIGTFVQACCANGVACIFTVAQGGHALGLTILNGNEKVKKYFTDAQEMEDYLAATVIKLVANLPQEVRGRLKP